MKTLFTKLFVLCFIFTFSYTLQAQQGVGKLSGKVLDTQTKEPLIGANVVVVNTQLGAATNVEGEYFVLGITPGTYDIKVSYIGYGPKTIKDVRIVSGVTYELNVELSTDLTLPEVIVLERKLIEAKTTNTVKVIDGDQISRLPVKGVTGVVSLQAGVVTREGSGGVDQNATLNVRGGRGGEVMYIIDGVPQNNVFDNTNSAQVSDHAVDQISFQVGGYEAKYGQAQSGIVNITTKSGSPNYTVFGDVSTSSGIDKYGYNAYSAGFGGPIIPGNPDLTIFASVERDWYLDATPPAVPLTVGSIGKTYDYRPNNSSGLWKFTGKINSNLGDFRLVLGANINTRDARAFILSFLKYNSDFNPKINEENYSYNLRLSQTITKSTLWNLNLGYREYKYENADPHFGDDLYAYGDSAAFNRLGIMLPVNPGTNAQIQGAVVQKDRYGIFWQHGRINGIYNKENNQVFNANFDFTSQVDKHLFEIGGGLDYNILRYFYIAPAQLAANPLHLPEDSLFMSMQPSVFGYDVTGRTKTDANSGDYAPKTPIFAYTYIQDRFELEDLVLNVGLRMDYFDSKTTILKNPSVPFAGGSNSEEFDAGDFTEKKSEIQFSPRIGLGFPVTESTVFHAQFGRFIQIPALNDLYTGPFDLITFQTMEPQYVQTGVIESEETTSYEIGFRQVIGNVAALNLTAFYKNIRGLVNRESRFFQRNYGGQTFKYIAPVNSDFGTTKGFAFSLDITKMSFFSLSVQYTFSLAEGTGSSTSSSQTSVFRNQNSEAPKVIAPLDFDQTHTGNVNVDFFIPKGEAGIFEMLNANMLLTFNSGRPYTPLDYYDLLSGNNGGPSTVGYVNSRHMPGAFRVDLRMEKSFSFSGLQLSPYVWVQNLFGAENIVTVWRSTGSPYTTGFLNTPDGKAAVERNGENYRQDYMTLENNPNNFGIPRMIRLGVRVNFSNAGL